MPPDLIERGKMWWNSLSDEEQDRLECNILVGAPCSLAFSADPDPFTKGSLYVLCRGLVAKACSIESKVVSKLASGDKYGPSGFKP
jgi:hypothetical protein